MRANSLPKAIELYEQMRRREGASPDIATYSVLIKACVGGHDLDQALCLLKDLRAAGRAPDDIILTHLLQGCRHAGNHALGKQLFAEMVSSGIKPSEYTLITMVKLHGRCGSHEESHEIVANWEARHGAKPSVIHFTCLLSGCLRTKSYDYAWVAYELMCQNGVKPDETTVATLFCLHCCPQCFRNKSHVLCIDGHALFRLIRYLFYVGFTHLCSIIVIGIVIISMSAVVNVNASEKIMGT